MCLRLITGVMRTNYFSNLDSIYFICFLCLYIYSADEETPLDETVQKIEAVLTTFINNNPRVWAPKISTVNMFN